MPRMRIVCSTRSCRRRDRDHRSRKDALVLERVRSKNANALFPIGNHLVVANFLQVNLQWELKLPITKTLRMQFARPLALWPHLEVHTYEHVHDGQSHPLEAYGPDDFAELAADPAKRDIFVATYRHSIVPRMRAVGDIWVVQRHLLDYPSIDSLDGPFATSGIDWTKLLTRSMNILAIRYATHADAWLPIMSMWEREEFSMMFPAAPYFYAPLFATVMAMMATAGQEEQKLLGMSAGSYMARWLSRDKDDSKDSEQSGQSNGSMHST